MRTEKEGRQDPGTTLSSTSEGEDPAKQLEIARAGQEMYKSFYEAAEGRRRRVTRRNIYLSLITAGALLLAGRLACHTPRVERVVVPYYTGKVESKTYEMNINNDGIPDYVHVSEFPPTVDLSNPDGTYRTMEWHPAGWEEHMAEQRED
ncbi:MAG: hypothetical protein ABIH92_04730 [Nanoarchaeota archaeon]